LPTVSLPSLAARALPLRTIVVLGLGPFVFGLLANLTATALSAHGERLLVVLEHLPPSL
jgi:hypothetical protein